MAPLRPLRPFALAAAACAAALLAPAAPSSAAPSSARPPAASAVPAAAGQGRPASAAPALVLPPVARLRITARTVATGLVEPVAVVAAPGGRLLVVERRGTIRVVSKGRVLRGFFADLRSVVGASGGEQGLLGVALDPRFTTTRRLWVAYTARGTGALVLARLQTGRGLAAAPVSSLRAVLRVPHGGASNHNGGSLVFGTDGYLYWGTGDGGGGGDPFDTARRGSSLLGKVLRLDVRRSCGTARYCIPPTNPRARGRTAWRPEVWLAGLRNPWRMSVDPATRTLWIGDVGQDRWEEVDRIPLGGGGLDLGWSCREGLEVFNAGRCTGRRLTPPLLVRCHPDSVAGCPAREGSEALIGGAVYRGTAQPILAGAYVFADFVTGNVWAWRGGAVATVGSIAGLTAIGRAADGELVATRYDGAVVRLVAVTA